MNSPPSGTEPLIEGLSAITFSTRDMRRAVHFYQALGFPLLHGGENEPFYFIRRGRVVSQPDRRDAWSDQLVGPGDHLCVGSRCDVSQGARSRI